MSELLAAAGVSDFEALGWQASLFATLLAFGLGQAIALAYMATFRGLSYSRAMVHGMALASVVTCMLMLAVSGSIALGIGVAAGLSAVRFRTSMRDPRDIIFVFAALGVGFACGAQAYPSAVIGTVAFAAGCAVLHFSGYGSKSQPDGLLRFVAAPGAATQTAIGEVLGEHCRSFSLVTLREAAQGNAMEHAYQISARSTDDRSKVVERLREVAGVRNVILLLQEPTLDI
jgi:hypothetical protein